MTIGIILAAGSGSRTGLNIPKQFVEVDFEMVVVTTIRKFVKSNVDQIIVALPEEGFENWVKLVSKAVKSDKVHYVKGGPTRHDSLINAINAGWKVAKDANFKAITHDGARPFVSVELINKHIEAVQDNEAVNTVLPIYDTVVKLNKNKTLIESVLDREHLLTVQTPQSFDVETFMDLVYSVKKEYTDAISLFTEKARVVKLIDGEPGNFKITTADDIQRLVRKPLLKKLKK